MKVELIKPESFKPLVREFRKLKSCKTVDETFEKVHDLIQGSDLLLQYGRTESYVWITRMNDDWTTERVGLITKE